MLVYYDRVPPPEVFAATPQELEAERYRSTPWSDESGKPDADGFGERFHVGGIECQVGLTSVGAFERQIAKLVAERDLSEQLLKIVSGLYEGLPLHGAGLVEKWRRDAAFTDELQRALIEKHWTFFPWWYFQERLRSRDATAWRYEVLAQSVYSIVGVVAALNRLYFSTFEFKRASKFILRFDVAPVDLAARLDALFDRDERLSTAELERLVAETQALVGDRLPDINLELKWGGQPTPPGERESPWPSDQEQPAGSKP